MTSELVVRPKRPLGGERAELAGAVSRRRCTPNLMSSPAHALVRYWSGDADEVKQRRCTQRLVDRPRGADETTGPVQQALQVSANAASRPRRTIRVRHSRWSHRLQRSAQGHLTARPRCTLQIANQCDLRHRQPAARTTIGVLDGCLVYEAHELMMEIRRQADQWRSRRLPNVPLSNAYLKGAAAVLLS